jgi:hypothetical protein
MRCGGATCEADHDSAGHSILGNPYAVLHQWEIAGKDREIKSVFRGRIMTLQAGAEAVEVIAGICPCVGDGDDRREIGYVLGQLDRGDACEARLRRHARQLVSRHRSTIERVAAALMARGSLTQKQIDNLVWPRTALQGFVTDLQLKKRYRIEGNLKNGTRYGRFPRAWVFNDRVRWRVRDVEAWRAARTHE